MKVYTLPIEMVNALRSWFHPKDRSIILDDNTFIEGEELSTPGNPSLNRGRLYWKNGFWTQLNSSGIENIITGPGLIAETTLTGNATSVTFSGIPQTFRHLMLMTQSRTDLAAEVDNVAVRFNGDTGPSYDFQQIFASSTTPAASTARAGSSLSLLVGEAAQSRASNFGPTVAYLFGYTLSDREKWGLSFCSVFGNVSADADLFILLRSGRWRNTTPINSITLFPGVGPNFVSGSRFQLYGVN